MVTREMLKRLAGQQVTLRLTPEAPGGPWVTGKILGTLEAADGLVVVLEPADAPGARLTYHYHYILAVEPGLIGG